MGWLRPTWLARELRCHFPHVTIKEQKISRQIQFSYILVLQKKGVQSEKSSQPSHNIGGGFLPGKTAFIEFKLYLLTNI